MDDEFWHNRWAENRIGFHQHDFNDWLKTWWAAQSVADTVLVPLCGKSRDMVWLAEQGHEVHGFELSPLAVEQFFSEHGWQAESRQSGPFRYHHHGRIHLYQGDFFEARRLGRRYALVYDRAALIALPPVMRVEYAKQLASMVEVGGQVLLVTMEYQPDSQQQPPFSVCELEVRQLFEWHFAIEVLGRQADEANPKLQRGELSYCDEVCYRLVRRARNTLPPLM